MADKSKIEWTDATWNPVTGCTKVSAGCKFCYAERDFHRPYPGRDFTDVQTHPERLFQPFRWRRPRRIFVDSMSDLFHEAIPTEFILKVFEVMAFAKRHTFQVLTKRPERMKHLLVYGKTMKCDSAEHHRLLCTMPLTNVWVGVSVEDQPTADERIPLLLLTPAAVRFVSYEPALRPVEFREYITETCEACGGQAFLSAESCHQVEAEGECCAKGLDWVISGGESGPKARPSHPDWFRSVRDQCQAAGVPFFFKQWGEWCPIPSVHFICQQYVWLTEQGEISMDFKVGADKQGLMLGTRCLARLGKPQQKRLGISSLLDGREWSEFPNPSLATNH